MDNDLECEDFTLDRSYCTVHGQDLDVLVSDNDELYVSYTDIKKAGFQIFRKDTFNAMLVDKRQINKEFEMHLLSEARRYFLRNKVLLDEKQILKTIENCKNNILQYSRPEPAQLLPGRKVVQSGSNLQISSQSNGQPSTNNNDFNTLPNYAIRPPKSIPTSPSPQYDNGTRHQENKMRSEHNTENQQMQRHASKDSLVGRSSVGSREQTSAVDDQRRGRPNCNNQRGGRSSGGQKSDQFSGNNGNGGRGRRSYENKGIGGANGVEEGRFGEDQANSSDGGFNKSQQSRQKEFVPSLTLSENNSYKVTVSHIEKDNIYWIQIEDKKSDMQQMQKEIQAVAQNIEVWETPMHGHLVLALFEDVWYRARVYNLDPVLAHYLDFGFKNSPEVLKRLPEKFKNIPALAVRAVINSDQNSLEKNKEYDITIRKKYGDGTYLAKADGKDDGSRHGSRQPTKSDRFKARSNDQTNKKDDTDEEFDTPKARKRSRSKSESRSENETWDKPDTLKVFIKVPDPVSILKDGDMVMICGIEDSKFLLKTRECCKRSKDLVEYIKKLDKSELAVKSVTKGQLVLCSKDDFPNLCRANVYEMEGGSIARVKYVDFPGEELLSVKSLRNVDQYLANEPKLLLESPVCQFLKDVGDKALMIISDLIEKKSKVTVVFGNDKFDLELEDESLLSEKITELNKSKIIPEVQLDSKPMKEANSYAEDKIESHTLQTDGNSNEKNEGFDEEAPIFFDEMQTYKPKLGKNDYLVYAINALDDITVISPEQDSIEYISHLTPIIVESEEPYEPEVMEMCLVSIEEKGEVNWYRAIMVSNEDDEFSLLSVDFGNQVTVKKESLRKYPSKLKDIPILGIPCTWPDVPQNEKVLSKVKELLVEGDLVEIIVEEYIEESFKYKIQIPTIRQELMDAKLL